MTCNDTTSQCHAIRLDFDRTTRRDRRCGATDADARMRDDERNETGRETHGDERARDDTEKNKRPRKTNETTTTTDLKGTRMMMNDTTTEELSLIHI